MDLYSLGNNVPYYQSQPGVGFVGYDRTEVQMFIAGPDLQMILTLLSV